MSFIAEQPEVQEVCRVCSSQSCSRSKTGSGIKGGKLSSLSPSIHNFILLSITSFLSKGSSRINYTVWFRQSVSSFLPSLFSSPFKLYVWYQGTVFIPTNEAFKLLPGDKMDKAISADLERWDCGTLCCKQIYHHCGLKIFITVTDGLLLWSLLGNPDTHHSQTPQTHCQALNPHQDPRPPLPGPKRAVRRHQDTTASERCWGIYWYFSFVFGTSTLAFHSFRHLQRNLIKVEIPSLKVLT